MRNVSWKLWLVAVALFGGSATFALAGVHVVIQTGQSNMQMGYGGIPELKKLLPEVEWAEDPYDAITDADARPSVPVDPLA
mgnify:CR=1 FL=1